jgi:hypothetical protein
MGFELSEAELRKWAKKYELWMRLHPNETDPVAKCIICMRGRGVGITAEDKCPIYVMHYNKTMGVMEIMTGRWPCQEWVKYV